MISPIGNQSARGSEKLVKKKKSQLNVNYEDQSEVSSIRFDQEL